jgi:hypothetical protein
MHVVAAALTLAAAAAPTVLPSGIYNYAIFDSGKPVGTSAISISRSGGSIRVAEDATLPDDRMETVRTLDPATFATQAYRVTTQGVTETLDVTERDATWHGTRKSETRARAADGPAVVFDFLTGMYAALPAMLDATRAKTFNVYCACFYGFEAKAARVSSATEARPDGVPPEDAVVACDFDDGTIFVWYDPATFVARYVDVPKARFRFVLQA